MPIVPIAGGCQCGAVRYAMHVAKVEKPHLCHCRMCQRATGGLFAALAGCGKADFAWTKGAPGWFASSSLAARPFCPSCGTPLGFAYNDPAARMYVTIGSLDDPEQVRVEKQYGADSRLSWVKLCEDAPDVAMTATPEEAALLAGMTIHQT